MHRTAETFSTPFTGELKEQMLGWANQFSICCVLDSSNYTSPYPSFDYLLAAGCHHSFSPGDNILSQLSLFTNGCNDWLFGHISFNLKQETEQVPSTHIDHIGFPDIFLFQPLTVITVKGDAITIACIKDDPKNIWKAIQNITPFVYEELGNKINIQSRISRKEYIDTVNIIKDHIHRGDCYELNFCQEFYATDTTIEPLQVFKQLVKVSAAPFAAFYKYIDKYLLCTSPERYLKKEGTTILSQPIKGTIHRDTQDAIKDDILKNNLQNNAKDRSENVMIVDLVRNDLSKICKENSVSVEELFGIYSFPQVHQMISTITGILKDDIDLAAVIKATFPMGSMTGAPKRKVLQLIEQYEKTKRGIFSGSIGYITPGKDFDFNVVIRSILYNAATNYISYQAGSAITFYADAEQEYEECLLKVKAIAEVLGGIK